MSELIAIFLAVFFAELGDKTQLATLLFASNSKAGPWAIFAAASLALILSTGLAVLAGEFAARYLTMLPLKLIAGAGFLAIGAWLVIGHFLQGPAAA